MTTEPENSLKSGTRFKSQKGLRNYTLIMDAALEVISEDGMSMLTVGHLCRTADIKRTSFYTYFKSIDNLLDELSVREFQKFEDAFQAEYPDTKWGVERFVRTTLFVFKCVVEEPAFSPRIAELLKYHPASMAAFIDANRDDVNSFIETGVLNIEQKDVEPYVQLISASLVNAIYRLSSGALPEGHGRRTIVLLLKAGGVDSDVIAEAFGSEAPPY